MGLILTFLSSFALWAAVPPGLVTNTREIAGLENADLAIDLTFAKGKTDLTSSDKLKLRRLLDQARKKGKLGEVKVLSWGDEINSPEASDDVKEREEKLGGERVKNLEKFLEGADKDVPINAYNMSTRADFVSRMLSTDEARLKRSLREVHAQAGEIPAYTPGNPSKSVVLIFLNK